MAQKLWEKNVQVNEEIDRFTVGRDREMDLYLAKHDILGSMAHITMLESIGLLTSDELKVLLDELKNIYASAEKGEFVIEDGIEDVHSQVELMLDPPAGRCRQENPQRTLTQRPGSGGPETVHACTAEESCRISRRTVPGADCTKQPLQGCPDAGLYPPADRHAVFLRPVVRCIRRKPGGRYGFSFRPLTGCATATLWDRLPATALHSL